MRFIAILFLAIWLGSIFFFAAVLAPTVFHVLPTHTLAGNVIFPSLTKLHYIGLVCAVLFIIFTVIDAMMSRPYRNVAPAVLLTLFMILGTVYAQYGIGAKMNNMRLEMGEIDSLPQTDARRVEFNRLHIWSTRIEGSVFFLGLGVLFLSSRRLS